MNAPNVDVCALQCYSASTVLVLQILANFMEDANIMSPIKVILVERRTAQ